MYSIYIVSLKDTFDFWSQLWQSGKNFNSRLHRMFCLYWGLHACAPFNSNQSINQPVMDDEWSLLLRTPHQRLPKLFS